MHANPSLLLVQLYSDLQPPDAEPYAVDVLAQAVRDSLSNWIVHTATLDQRAGSSVESVLDQVRAVRPRVFGISVPQGTYGLAVRLLEQLSTLPKEEQPFLTVLGHAVPTYAAEEFLGRFPDVVIVRGWGERALISLLTVSVETTKHDLSRVLSDVPSLAFMSDRHMTRTVVAPPSRVPVLVQRTPGRYLRRLEGSRGCQYGRCTFCTRPPGARDSWTRAQPATLRDALIKMRDDGVTFFTFADEDFIGDDLSGASEIADILLSLQCFTFSISVRSDNVWKRDTSLSENRKRKDLLSKLRCAGLSFVFLGLESLSDSQLTRFGKGVRVRDSLQAMAIIRDLDVSLEVGFMLFDPFVTTHELLESTEALRSSRAWPHVSNIFSRLRVQRGTAYEAFARKHGLLGEFNPELISYDWRFASVQAEQIWLAGETWSATFHPALRLVRNAFRQFPQENSLLSFLVFLRDLDLRALEALLAERKSANVNAILSPLIDARAREWQKFIPHLAKKYQVAQEELVTWLKDPFYYEP